MDSRKNWRGFVSVEADTVALREPYGRDIRQIFVDQDSIAQVREETVQIGGGAAVVELTWNDSEGKQTMWHSSAHLLAEAVEALYPGAKFGIGPAIDNGFYYDIDFGDKTISIDDSLTETFYSEEID